jgi:hypothetical protein
MAVAGAAATQLLPARPDAKPLPSAVRMRGSTSPRRGRCCVAPAGAARPWLAGVQQRWQGWQELGDGRVRLSERRGQEEQPAVGYVQSACVSAMVLLMRVRERRFVGRSAPCKSMRSRRMPTSRLR